MATISRAEHLRTIEMFQYYLEQRNKEIVSLKRKVEKLKRTKESEIAKLEERIKALNSSVKNKEGQISRLINRIPLPSFYEETLNQSQSRSPRRYRSRSRSPLN